MSSHRAACHAVSLLLLSGVASAADPAVAPDPMKLTYAGVAGAPAATGLAQPRLPTVMLRVAGAELAAEVACRRQEQERGLMHRASLGEGEGMLFVFDRPYWLSFWMKDTPLPLTVAYLDAQGVIRELHDLQPFDTTRVDSQRADLQFALEVPRGWFVRHGIGLGSTIATASGPLAGFRCATAGPGGSS